MSRTRVNPVSASALRSIAIRQALMTYRDAFKRGQLSTVHHDVVLDAYDLAADELFARAKRERGFARWWGLGWAVWAIGWIVAAIAFGLTPSLSGWSGWVFVVGAWLLIKTSENYARANAYRVGAYLLARPLAYHMVQANGDPMPDEGES